MGIEIYGFMNETELSWLYEQALEMNIIVEIGSFEGRSTNALLSANKGTVYSIDSFDKRFATSNNLINFITNVAHFENFKFLKMPNEEAIKCFDDKSIDMVFIDADHDYDAIKSDIERWLPKTKTLICGHDYDDPGHPGVKKAVDEKFENIEIIDTIWFKRL